MQDMAAFESYLHTEKYLRMPLSLQPHVFMSSSLPIKNVHKCLPNSYLSHTQDLIKKHIPQWGHLKHWGSEGIALPTLCLQGQGKICSFE